MSDTVASNFSCHLPNPDVVSECGLSELRSSIHSDDKIEHDDFFVQTCLEEMENAEYTAPQKPLLSIRGEEPMNAELAPDPGSESTWIRRRDWGRKHYATLSLSAAHGR